MGKKNDVPSWFTRPGAQKGQKNRGGQTPYNIKREKKVPVAYVLGIL